MSQPHAHTHAPAHRAVAVEPGWSLLRLSAGQRLAIAGAIAGLVWAATLLVIW
ncbi:hypothetical protein [Bosea sp. Leaf344]|uniref:hypothetical protein n=1 Tax=Bosea sp. Leaf344 TaxID=1736346 RepID=UPI000A95BF86|nr:hypothetical protein [Bosea sp. Leaf344]